MRKLVYLLLLLVAGFAAAGTGITLIPGTRFEYTNCSSSGSASQTVTSNTYLLRVADEDVFVCYAATCAAAGEKFPMGTVMLLTFNGDTSFSCRSANSTGDVVLTKAQF